MIVRDRPLVLLPDMKRWSAHNDDVFALLRLGRSPGEKTQKNENGEVLSHDLWGGAVPMPGTEVRASRREKSSGAGWVLLRPRQFPRTPHRTRRAQGRPASDVPGSGRMRRHE